MDSKGMFGSQKIIKKIYLNSISYNCFKLACHTRNAVTELKSIRIFKKKKKMVGEFELLIKILSSTPKLKIISNLKKELGKLYQPTALSTKKEQFRF